MFWVFPRLKNMTFLTLHINIWTSLQWQERAIGV